MTAKELIKKLEEFPEDTMVILGDGEGPGWANIETVKTENNSIVIRPEMYPVFSDN